MTLSKFLFVRPFSISGENGEMTHFFTVTFSSLIASHTLTLTYSRCEECVCVCVCVCVWCVCVRACMCVCVQKRAFGSIYAKGQRL